LVGVVSYLMSSLTVFNFYVNFN